MPNPLFKTKIHIINPAKIRYSDTSRYLMAKKTSRSEFSMPQVVCGKQGLEPQNLAGTILVAKTLIKVKSVVISFKFISHHCLCYRSKKINTLFKFKIP